MKVFFFLGEGNWFPAEIVRKIEAKKKREGHNEDKEGGGGESNTSFFFFYIWEFRAKMNLETCRERRIGRVSGLGFSGNIFRGSSSMFFLKKNRYLGFFITIFEK